MASAQTPNGMKLMTENVHYDPNATPPRHDTLPRHGARACVPPQMNVVFDFSTPTTYARATFLRAKFPSAPIVKYTTPQPTSDRHTFVIGYADITVPVSGILEIPHGLRAMGNATLRHQRQVFTFNLRVQVVDGPGTAVVRNVLIGSRDMAHFNLALRAGKPSPLLVLRADRELSTRGIFSLLWLDQVTYHGLEHTGMR